MCLLRSRGSMLGPFHEMIPVACNMCGVELSVAASIHVTLMHKIVRTPMSCTTITDMVTDEVPHTANMVTVLPFKCLIIQRQTAYFS